jgi:hypothetical protein
LGFLESNKQFAVTIQPRMRALHDPSARSKMSVKPLQDECKKRSISIYRTKAAFIKLLG